MYTYIKSQNKITSCTLNFERQTKTVEGAVFKKLHQKEGRTDGQRIQRRCT